MRILLYFFLWLVALFVIFLALSSGSEWLSPVQMLNGATELLTVGTSDYSTDATLLWWRLPRVLSGFLCGGMLAIAGAMFQRVFQNPLVSPDILGTSAGAALGCVIALSAGGGLLWSTCGAVLGGTGAASIALITSIVLGSRHGINVLVLILCGILLSSFLASIIGIWRYLTPDNGALRGIYYILAGGLGTVGWQELIILAITAFICIVPILLLVPFLRLLALPAEVLQTQGINVLWWSVLTLFIGALMTAVTVTVAGVIGWVALVIPNLVKYVTRGNPALMSVGLFGGVFLVLADMLGRSFGEAEIPAGIITGLAGIPFFILVLYLELKKPYAK